MPKMTDIYSPPPELALGVRLNKRVPEADQKRQRKEVEDILRRLRGSPGVILADEVGMGKTFVALAIAYSVAVRSPRGPVVIMVPPNLVEKWKQDLNTFCELYLDNVKPVDKDMAVRKDSTPATSLRYGVARHSIELMKLLDDPRHERCHMIFLAQGAMGRSQSDKWVRLALIAECLRRHARGGAVRLIQVKQQIHRFLAELLWALGEERANDWGEELWQKLLHAFPSSWKEIYNKDTRENRQLADDPVPKSVIRAMEHIELGDLADALKDMPVRARGGETRVSDRLKVARDTLRNVEEELWKKLLAQARWRSPLLVMDEAHHLKNPRTLLARQLQSPESEEDLRTGDGAMANAFDRMLFLTATPFQLGHHELVNVLERFGDVRWNPDELGSTDSFHQKLLELRNLLNESQRTTIALQKCWSRLRLEDCDSIVEDWWGRLYMAPRESLNNHQRSIVEAFDAAKKSRNITEKALRPWIVRHNKDIKWEGTSIVRRQRIDGAAIAGKELLGGLMIPGSQLLPFFLAARSAASYGQDLLGEALSSSYEAFRFTRKNRDAAKDELDAEVSNASVDFSHSSWYLGEFDRALESCSGALHPKVHSTVQRVVDLWEFGEKVLVFAFYRRTCKALRIHISKEIERRIMSHGQDRLRKAGRGATIENIEKLILRIRRHFFDDLKSRGRQVLDAALNNIIQTRAVSIHKANMSPELCEILVDVMRRFLRVSTTLVRCFPIAEWETISEEDAVRMTLDFKDASDISWGKKCDGFVNFLTEECSTEERNLYLEASKNIGTRNIRITGDDEDSESDDATGTLANVQVATGTTPREARARLMRAFNTPFFPDILVCSQVMGEGVDLQRFCRHVVHHDLDWNPSSIEQRTGRVDRLGCKAEGRNTILIYVPYLSGTADERQYKVMSDRERWFRVVMGQDEVARLITPDSNIAFPLPRIISEELSFKLDIEIKKPTL